jgi:SAM-dependent methyltransferase
MTDAARTRGRVPAPYPPKDHWEYNLYEYHRGLPDQSHYQYMTETPGVKTAEHWKEWCQALFYAGTTLTPWNESPELKAAFLSACSLDADQDVLVVGKYVDETGLGDALRSMAGAAGSVMVEEIGSRAIAAIRAGGPRKAADAPPGTKLQWDFDFVESLAGASLDRVILFNAASHVADWDRFAARVDRVLRPGGRLVVGEAPLGGKEFRDGLCQDAHYESFILRVLTGLGLRADELPDIAPAELTARFEPYLAWSRSYSRQGVYLFYGEKAGAAAGCDGAPPVPGAAASAASAGQGTASPSGAPARLVPITVFPRADAAVGRFLEAKPTTGVWDHLSREEQEVWGPVIEDILTPHMGKCVTWGGGALCWNYRNQREITDIMWSNLAVQPGDKVMYIGEFPVDLGVLPELQERVGPDGEIAMVEITSSPKSYDYKGWQAKRKMYMEQGSPEEWPYDFADDYPDGYFDVLFLPQGVHHCNNWLRDAPRLLRAVKPGGQVMAMECGINRPQMNTARDLSALVRVIGDRVFKIALPDWLVGPLSPEGPLPPGTGYEHVGRPYHDVSTEHLRESFGDGLTDVCSLEYKGWILFWGFKR